MIFFKFCVDKMAFSMYNVTCRWRSVAQFGRALRSGRRGRGFESRHFDYLAGAPKALRNQGFRCFFILEKRRLETGCFWHFTNFLQIYLFSPPSNIVSLNVLFHIVRTKVSSFLSIFVKLFFLKKIVFCAILYSSYKIHLYHLRDSIYFLSKAIFHFNTTICAQKVTIDFTHRSNTVTIVIS